MDRSCTIWLSCICVFYVALYAFYFLLYFSNKVLIVYDTMNCHYHFLHRFTGCSLQSKMPLWAEIAVGLASSMEPLPAVTKYVW
jgi:hypothetical protein